MTSTATVIILQVEMGSITFQGNHEMVRRREMFIILGKFPFRALLAFDRRVRHAYKYR